MGLGMRPNSGPVLESRVSRLLSVEEGIGSEWACSWALHSMGWSRVRAGPPWLGLRTVLHLVAMYENPSCFTSLSRLDLISLYFSPSAGYVVVSDCGLNWWSMRQWGTVFSFCIFYHLDMLCCEVSVQWFPTIFYQVTIIIPILQWGIGSVKKTNNFSNN